MNLLQNTECIQNLPSTSDGWVIKRARTRSGRRRCQARCNGIPPHRRRIHILRQFDMPYCVGTDMVIATWVV